MAVSHVLYLILPNSSKQTIQYTWVEFECKQTGTQYHQNSLKSYPYLFLYWQAGSSDLCKLWDLGLVLA